jgi:hypothetical protein
MLVRFRFIALVLLVALSTAAVARATVPPGPRLAFVASHPYPNVGSEIATVGADGGLPLGLVGGSSPSAVSPIDGARPSWSADGSSFAFTGVRDGATAALFIAATDGTHLHVIPASRKILFEGSSRLPNSSGEAHCLGPYRSTSLAAVPRCSRPTPRNRSTPLTEGSPLSATTLVAVDRHSISVRSIAQTCWSFRHTASR